jgi:hypothetical protein
MLFSIAIVVIALFYLIARPRIGTVWYVTITPAPPPPSGASLTTSPPGFSDKPPSGFIPDTPPPRWFTDERDCDYAVGAYRQESGYCDSRYALLWGW